MSEELQEIAEELQEIAAIVGGSLALTITFGAIFSAILIAPELLSSHQRYTTYLEAQRTVLQCRADHVTEPDRICGPIPTLESIE